ncbi:MAG TPA: type IV secretion system DNA-binding domain-containing protein [Candidatus Paceibacterota bacterium]|nr:type IV secretion system DNA-binding domain-containing protein [Candidatus Paceibacterota bacterium]
MENPERVTYFAATDSRGKYVPFGIKSKDRDRHMYVIGKTGMGKSTLLENMAIQDIRNGEGLAFIDPHGGTVERLLDYIPEHRIKDVVYFAPFDLDHPIAFNVMEDVGYDKRHLVVSGLMATFKKIWVDAWSSRMEYILTNTLLALLEYPGATLLGVNRMYTDKEYRKKVVENVKDPVVKDFWTKEYAVYTDRYTQEATPAIQNKVGQFTGNPLIRNIIGQSKSSFDIREMMDQKKILIINLSKGLVGETNMRLLGSMLTTRIFLAAMSRANLSAPDLASLPHFYFYVDEFQNFANQTFAEILSESRKYKLNLVIAHQYIEQMEEEVRDAVFGNVGTTVVFRVGPFDAEVLEPIFAPRFTKEDIVTLDRRQVYMTLMIDGVGSAPFSAVTIPPIEPPPSSFRDGVVASSRELFTTPRQEIEQHILDELSSTAGPAEPERKFQRSERPRHEAPHRAEQASTPHYQPRKEEERPTPTPHYQPRKEEERPTPTKSADDLKAILRTMTAKEGAEREHKASTQKQTLKGTLADVLARSAPAPESPKPVEKSRDTRPEQGARPYEISEERLRSVLKGEE